MYHKVKLFGFYPFQQKESRTGIDFCMKSSDDVINILYIWIKTKLWGKKKDQAFHIHIFPWKSIDFSMAVKSAVYIYLYIYMFL